LTFDIESYFRILDYKIAYKLKKKAAGKMLMQFYMATYRNCL